MTPDLLEQLKNVAEQSTVTPELVKHVLAQHVAFGGCSMMLDTGDFGEHINKIVAATTHVFPFPLDLSAIAERLAGLQRIVDALPKTADGVPVDLSRRPVMLWIACDEEGYGIYEECCYDRDEVEKAYSTREAASAAIAREGTK